MAKLNIKIGDNRHEVLKGIVDQIEEREAQKKEISDEIKEILADAKSAGFDTKIIRRVIALRKMDADERDEHLALIETYLHSLGNFSDTPLGDFAMSSDGKV